MFACTACMMMRSYCPRHAWLRYSLLIVSSVPYSLAGLTTAPITLTFPPENKAKNSVSG